MKTNYSILKLIIIIFMNSNINKRLYFNLSTNENHVNNVPNYLILYLILITKVDYNFKCADNRITVCI